MANNIEYGKIFQAALDQQVTQQSTTGWMEGNAGQIKYNGGNEVKLPTLSTQGLGDYNRETGYVNGSITQTWATYTLTQDRGRSFSIDAMDVDESAFVATAGNVMGEFQRRYVIPEIDAYRYSKICDIADNDNRSAVTYLTVDNAFTQLLDDLAALEDENGEEQLIVSLSPLTLRKIAGAPEFKNLTADAVLKQGNLDIRLKAINNAVLRPVPSTRLKTAYIFADGKTSGQTDGGFKPAAGASNINWLITPSSVPIAVSKTDNVRIFTPDTNQSKNAWKLDYRKYHELWIKNNQVSRIFANIEGEPPEPPEQG
jgi:hypothetical protein